jgi:hypothetical protein
MTLKKIGVYVNAEEWEFFKYTSYTLKMTASENLRKVIKDYNNNNAEVQR